MMAQKKNIETIIKNAEKIGIANPVKVRNLRIRMQYREMREKFIKYDDAITLLSGEHFLSLTSIQRIIKGCKNGY